MVNPKGTPKTLGVIPLSAGEYSRPVRVRAPAWVFDALSGRSAAEVGRLLESSLRGTNEPVVSLEPATSTPTSPNALRGTDEPVVSLELVKPEPTALRGTPAAPKRSTSGLSSTLVSIADSLKAGAIAEYDHREKKWMVSDRHGTYPVYKRHLEELVKAGLARQLEGGRYRAK